MGIGKKELYMNTKNQKRLTDQGFTLVELMVAMAISLVVMGAIFLTFKSQQDSYVIQDQITATQQNLRSAMYMLTRDIQMAGYYTNFDGNQYTMDWDDLDGDNEIIRPLIYARNNVNVAGDNIKDNTDVIVIIKASNILGNFRQLTPGESATGSNVDATLRNVDNLLAGKCALLVKDNLSRAEFFQVQEDTGAMNLIISLIENYGENDWIYRADVIIYYVDDEDDPGDANDNDDPAHPKLRRKNLGSNQGAQVVAENIDNLQFRYLLNSGLPLIDNPSSSGNEPNVRAVEISLLARTANTNRGYIDPNTYSIGDVNYTPNNAYRRKLLCSIIKTRNIGL